MEIFWICSKLWSLNFGFLGFFGGPGGFRKVREVCRKNFPQFSSKSDFLVTSYDQKTKSSRLLNSRLSKFECIGFSCSDVNSRGALFLTVGSKILAFLRLLEVLEVLERSTRLIEKPSSIC